MSNARFWERVSLLAGCLVLGMFCGIQTAGAEDYLSPAGLAAHGGHLWVADATALRVSVIDADSGKLKKQAALEATPTHLSCSPDGRMLFVSLDGAPGKVLVLNADDLSVHATVPAGHTPSAAVAGKDGLLYVCNQFDNEVAVYEAGQAEPVAKIAVPREPVAAALSPDGQSLVVANLLPSGAGDGAYTAAHVSIIDTASRSVAQNIQLPNGSTSLRGVCVSPDGKHAYVTHILARYQLPTTQLERGWMNTNALSVIDVSKRALVNTVLLDSVDLGAANPWGVACTEDGALLCVAHAGTHELSIIDRAALHAKLDKVAAGEAVTEVSQKAEDVPNDLSFMVDVRRRVKLEGNGSRSLALLGKRTYVGNYYSGELAAVDLDNAARPLLASIGLGEQPKADTVRWGDQLFHDADLCFQHWQSCASCHPDVRADGLNWDLLNDGMGNPKSTKSMLFTHATPPSMMSGIRDSGEVAVRAGIRHILFAVRPEEEAKAMDEFLKALKPAPSPKLVNGALSESARRGQEVFEKAACAKCHTGEYYTDLKAYDVGTAKGLDSGKDYDTPTLREVWRTAPYLNDGRAATMRDVLTTHNPDDKHGVTKALSEQEMADLEAYVLSL